MIEVEFSVPLFDNVFVSLLKIFWQDHISVLSHGLHTCLLADRMDVGGTHFFWSGNEIFKINFFRQIHSVSQSLEHKTLLSSVREREFNFSIKSSRSQKSRIQCISSVGSHDTFDVNCLIKTIHLLEQLN